MRLLNKLYAKLNGYFWLPCPVCKEHFGGHEASFVGLVVDEADGEHAYCTCYKPECQDEAQRRNVERAQRLNRSVILPADSPLIQLFTAHQQEPT